MLLPSFAWRGGHVYAVTLHFFDEAENATHKRRMRATKRVARIRKRRRIVSPRYGTESSVALAPELPLGPLPAPAIPPNPPRPPVPCVSVTFIFAGI